MPKNIRVSKRGMLGTFKEKRREGISITFNTQYEEKASEKKSQMTPPQGSNALRLEERRLTSFTI